MAIGIFYGSNGGATETVAETIQEKLELESTLHDIADVDMSQFDKYSHIIIGTSTWGEGELQDDWEKAFEDFQNVSFAGKTLAFFGLGDQEGYEENFLDGMGILHDAAVNSGALVVGNAWSTESYEYDESVAEQDGGFVGLGIDDDNQYDLTNERIVEWIKIIKPSFE